MDGGDYGDDYGDYGDDGGDYGGDYGDYGSSSGFKRMYRCCPMSYFNKEELEKGDKIILPPSALDCLGYLEVEYPMLFQLESQSSGKVTHCGVLEFTAEEGMVLLPSWMMEGMVVEWGDLVVVKNVSLPKGTYVKLQPHSKEFLDVSNPRAILETTLRNYTCLTTGGTIVIPYNNKMFCVDILETKPSHAICIIDTDCEAEFAPPLDYVEPEKPAKSTSKAREEVDEESERKMVKHVPFTGSGRRLNGKPSTEQVEPISFPVLKHHEPKSDDGCNDSTTNSRRLVFGSNAKDGKPKNPPNEDPTSKEANKFKAFSGRKYLLQ